MVWPWILMLIGFMLFLAYHRASLIVIELALLASLLILTTLSTLSTLSLILLWLIWCALILIHAIPWLHQRLIFSPLLTSGRAHIPKLSATEQAAINAGNIGFEAELFKGMPNWEQLRHYHAPTLSQEEQAFLHGPVTQLCELIDDWDITHHHCDLPPELWQMLKDEGFFGLQIDTQYGGKGFSALAVSEILAQIAQVSITTASTVSVPNALGPAELLERFGTQDQKEYYLPRLATGSEVPCFALTSREAGSDATAITDTGTVCQREYLGKTTLGIALHWDKRYITLGPIATLIGLVFKLFDPDHLLSDNTDRGITVALVPANSPGITRGRRHFPLNIAFQNGPLQGEDVFIPLDNIIGGSDMIGQGWIMLTTALAAGRGISLPAVSAGSARITTLATGAYARIRSQFKVPISTFEGIQTVLARMAKSVYLMEAARVFTANQIDLGYKSAVAGAIVKYHITEMERQVIIDAMDIHGGKGICLGPHNYLGRHYQSLPIVITVEGANIMTRNLMIYGQGVMRCHPHLLPLMTSCTQSPSKAVSASFAKAMSGWVGHIISNACRSIWLSLTRGKLTQFNTHHTTRYYYQQLTRFSAAFALISDITLLTLGARLKRKEKISARLGDLLSLLYLSTCALKRFQDQGAHTEDLVLLKFVLTDTLYQLQQAFLSFIEHFPNQWLKCGLRLLIFPSGPYLKPPHDHLESQIASILLTNNAVRNRLWQDQDLSAEHLQPAASVIAALDQVLAAEPIEQQLKLAIDSNKIAPGSIEQQVIEAIELNILTETQAETLLTGINAKRQVLDVDHFSSEELMR